MSPFFVVVDAVRSFRSNCERLSTVPRCEPKLTPRSVVVFDAVTKLIVGRRHLCCHSDGNPFHDSGLSEQPVRGFIRCLAAALFEGFLNALNNS